ncbi:general substrate transporter [Lipomyces kononenkoae]|uniref:General substrate transporter n=1 Tax=Lipomyces kononenkoae TaxID=34357 RepID=A0ACC3STF8_LIPKO
MVKFLNVYSISAFVALGGALFGFDIASISVVVGTDQYKTFYGNPLGIIQGAITSSMAAGSIIGASLSSFLADRFSRKVAIQLGAIVWCVGAAVQSASTGVPMLCIGRAIGGLCIGLTSAIVPIYQSEIAPRKFRGRIVSFQQFSLTLGILVQYYVQYACSFIKSEAAFRLPWALQSVPAIILFFGLFVLPRSPRWLANKGRWDDVLHVLAFLRTFNADINDPLVLAEFKEIEDQVQQERVEQSNSYRELCSRKLRKRMFLAVAIQVFSQLTGTDLLVYYIVYLLSSASIQHTLLMSSIIYILFCVATIPSIIWTDQWGRRLSLLLGALSMSFWLYLIGGLLSRYGQSTTVQDQSYTWIIVGHPAASRCVQASLYLSAASFAMTWGPVSWMYPPEIMPVRVRATAVSLSTASNWCFNYLLGFGVPSLLRMMRWRLFFLFGSLNMAAFFFVLLQVPETKQRTLEEIDEVFEYEKPLWRSLRGREHIDRLEALASDIREGQVQVSVIPRAASYEQNPTCLLQ